MGINTVAVVGAGTMGAGIAQVCAQAGWKTALFDAFPDGLERGMQRIDAFWDKGIARGKTTAEQKEALFKLKLKIFEQEEVKKSRKKKAKTDIRKAETPIEAIVAYHSFLK